MPEPEKDEILDEFDAPEEVEAQPEPEVAAEPEPEPEQDAEPEAEPAQEAEAAAEPEPGVEAQPEADPAEASSKDLKAEKAKSAALLAEITKLRASNRELRQPTEPRAQAQPAMPYEEPQATPAPPAGEAIPVQMSDGNLVIPRDQISQMITEATTPSPEEQRAQKQQQMYSDFVAQDEGNAEVWKDADLAMTWLVETVKSRAGAIGLEPSQMGTGGFMEFAKQSGAMGEFAEHWPDMVQDIGTIVGASVTQDEYMISQAMTNYAARRRAARASSQPVTPAPAPQTQAPNAPPNLAGVGTPTPAGTGDMSKLETLEKMERENFFDMKPGQVAELERLQGKLRPYG